MIFGTGIDIIEIDRIKQSIRKYSDRFEQKVFTKKEVDYCHSQADPVKHFAARFSEKEAVLKCLHGKGKELFYQLKLKRIHISITHDKNYAVAHAIAEK